MSWHKRIIAIAAVMAILAGVWELYADNKLEGKKLLTHKEAVSGRQYGLMLQVDVDDIESWALQQVAAGVTQYASIRLEIKHNGEWLAKEYGIGDARKLVEALDLKPLYCCDKIEAAKEDESWTFCPFCGAKR